MNGGEVERFSVLRSILFCMAQDIHPETALVDYARMTHMLNASGIPQCNEIMKFVSDVEKKLRDVEMTMSDPTSVYMRAYLEMPASLEAARFSMWCERIRAIQMNLSESRRFYVEQFQQIEQSKQILIEEAKTFKARSDALQMKELKKSKSPKTAPSKTAASLLKAAASTTATSTGAPPASTPIQAAPVVMPPETVLPGSTSSSQATRALPSWQSFPSSSRDDGAPKNEAKSFGVPDVEIMHLPENLFWQLHQSEMSAHLCWV